MPDRNTEAEVKLRKLGERLRQGWARQHPMSEKSQETVRDAVREQWEREQQSKDSKSQGLKPARNQDRQPEPPDREI